MADLRGILWDLDGVLVDSGEAHYQSWVSALAEMGVPYTWEQFHATFGMNNAAILALVLEREPAPDEMLAISDRKEALFRDLVRGRVQLLPGVPAYLEYFRKAGIRQAVASSAPIENVDQIVAEVGLAPYMDAVVSSFSLPGRPSKPNPAVFLEAARALGAAPGDCLVIEDALVGIEAARAGGMRCLAVATTHPLEKLAGADWRVDRLDRLAPDQVHAWFEGR